MAKTTKTPKKTPAKKRSAKALPVTAPPVALMSQRGYAEHRGVSHTAVQKAIRDGRITTIGGRIDPAAADRAWAENTDEGRPGVKDPAGRKKTPPPRPPKAAASADDPPAESAPDEKLAATAVFAESRAVREEFLARLAKLDYEQKRGVLVASDEVRLATFKVARDARNKLLTLPDRLASILAAMTTAREVHALLATDIRRICEEIANDDGC